MAKKISKNKSDNWKVSSADVFWAEIAPCDHVLQVYEHDDMFIETLASFVETGINAGDSSIVIASNAHMRQLKQKLKANGLQVKTLIEERRYVPFDAEDMLAKFMVNDWPDGQLFEQTITEVVLYAGGGSRRIRAFGEMVAILWAQGHCGATVHLEALWNQFMRTRSFPLFCAYPKSGFTQDMKSSIESICSHHSKIVACSPSSNSEILYLNTVSIAV